MDETFEDMLQRIIQRELGTDGLNYYLNKTNPTLKPVDYGTCKNCIWNLETSETSLVSECQLTIDELTGIGVMFSRDFGCNQWQYKGEGK